MEKTQTTNPPPEEAVNDLAYKVIEILGPLTRPKRTTVLLKIQELRPHWF